MCAANFVAVFSLILKLQLFELKRAFFLSEQVIKLRPWRKNHS